MTTLAQNLIRATDALVARAYLAVRRERSALLCFLFHSIFRDRREIDLNLVDPLDRTTVSHLRQLIEYYLQHGYRFVSPADLLAGLDPTGLYAMLTFDDGYFNNSLALPLLETYRVPALFFISTNHVLRNKCFWWDVLYRQRIAQRVGRRRIYREALSLKSLRTDEIEARLLSLFGPGALQPRGDVDRPFTPDELRRFAASPHVHLGNHTADHAILTNYTPDEIIDQIRLAQQALHDMTGQTPVSIAYPNGAHDHQVLRACADLGLRLGFTIRPQKVHLPLDHDPRVLLRLGRIVPYGRRAMTSQCRTYRSDLRLYSTFRDGYLRLFRRRNGKRWGRHSCLP